jgi:galactokinase
MDTARKERVEQAFEKLYGALPDLWVQAPGRVDLMGSHTDYNEGFVLTEAIEKNTWIAARRRDDETARVGSLNIDGLSSFSLDRITYDEATPWTNYMRGVAHVLLTEGFPSAGFDALVDSTISPKWILPDTAKGQKMNLLA